MIAARTTARGLTQVAQEQDGGMVIRIGPIKPDPEGTQAVYGREGPTIGLAIGVSDPSPIWMSISYLLTPTSTGWQAEQYLTGVP
jgi:hypothetical protein